MEETVDKLNVIKIKTSVKEAFKRMKRQAKVTYKS